MLVQGADESCVCLCREPGLRSRSRRFSEGVGVGIFYPTPIPHVHFLYVLVMLAAQLTRPRAPVECSTVIFLREPCRVSRDTACDSQKVYILICKQIIFCVMLCSGSLFSCFPFFNPMTGSKCQVHNQFTILSSLFL